MDCLCTLFLDHLLPQFQQHDVHLVAPQHLKNHAGHQHQSADLIQRVLREFQFATNATHLSNVAMVGGGSHVIRPGACSLAHHGVLFIDEAPECGPGILDALRQPLESGTISIARSIGNMTFPARFLLVLAANPCPCGKFAGRGRGCTCTSVQVRRYLAIQEERT